MTMSGTSPIAVIHFWQPIVPKMIQNMMVTIHLHQGSYCCCLMEEVFSFFLNKAFKSGIINGFLDSMEINSFIGDVIFQNSGW